MSLLRFPLFSFFIGIIRMKMNSDVNFGRMATSWKFHYCAELFFPFLLFGVSRSNHGSLEPNNLF